VMQGRQKLWKSIRGSKSLFTPPADALTKSI